MTPIYNNQAQLQNSCISQTFPCLHLSMSKIMQLALPALGIIALSYIPMAKAGQAEYEDCIADCQSTTPENAMITGIPYQFLLAICLLGCKILGL